MKLKTILQYRILFLRLWRGIFKPIILLSLPLILATSSIWLKWLTTQLPIDFSKWINDSYSQLVSLFGVLAGAYLTLYATYTLRKREERQKSIDSKKLAFYSPFFNEIVDILETRKKGKIIDFRTTNQLSGGIRVKWEFWYEVNNSLIGYNVPIVFKKKINSLDTQIKKYTKSYILASKFSNDYIFTELNGIIVKCHYSSFFSTLEKVYYGSLTENSYMNKINGKVNTPISKEVVDIIITNIKESTEYKEFIKDLNEMTDMLEDVFDGLNYILTKIHRKYKGSNILL